MSTGRAVAASGASGSLGERDRVTVLIPTKNEEVHIARCVASVAPLGRVIVVDAESDDRTVELAERAGADVFVHPWSGYAAQKNWALENTGITSPWILLMDADEYVTMETRDAIRAIVLGNGEPVGYWLPRRYVFLGRELRYAWWYPDFQLRLIRAGAGRFEPRRVHEHLVVDGPVEYLWADIWHENLKGIGAFVDRHNRYAELEAEELVDPTEGIRKGSWFGDRAARRRAVKLNVWMRLPFRPALRFFWMYIVRAGFRDGRPGLYYCLLIAWYDLLANVKHYELGHRAPLSEEDTGRPHPRAGQSRRSGFPQSSAPV